MYDETPDDYDAEPDVYPDIEPEPEPEEQAVQVEELRDVHEASARTARARAAALAKVNARQP